MRGTSKWQAWLLKAGLAVMALAPNVGFGQEPGRPDPVFPLPIGHDRMETGGFFVDGNVVLFRQTNPLRNQPIAFRGFTDSDGSFSGVPGTFVYSPIAGTVLNAGSQTLSTTFTPTDTSNYAAP